MINWILLIAFFVLCYLSFRESDFVEYETKHTNDDNLDPTEVFQSEKRKDEDAE